MELLSDFAVLREEWTSLAERADSIFATWEWSSIWWRYLGEDRPLYLGTCRDSDGHLVAIIPLYLASRRPLRVIRLVGRGPGDELGPICAPDDRAVVAPAIPQVLDLIRPGWNVFIAENLPGDPAWHAIGRTVQLSSIPNPALSMEGMSWDQFLASRSAKFRQQIRRNERRLARDHGLEYRLVEDTQQFDRDIDALFSLHHTRWGEESSGVFAGAESAFQRDFARSALERGWLRFWLLYLDGKPAAARLGFRFGEVESGYQSGRDPAWDRYGIGFLLQAHAIQEAMNDGMREFRLLRGGEAYKGRLANVNRSLETLALAHGLAGRTALAAGRAVLTLPPEKRQWLSKLAGAR